MKSKKDNITYDVTINIDSECLINSNIKYLRESRGFTQEEIGKIIGKERSVISLWERNTRKPSLNDLIKISNNFDISLDRLVKTNLKLNRQNQPDTSPSFKIPVYNIDNLSLDNENEIVNQFSISYNWLNDDREYYGVVLNDDSMSPNYLNKDFVIVLKTSDFKDGKENIVKVGKEKAVLRRIIKQSNGIILQSLNSKYPTKFFTFEEMTELPIRIMGEVKLLGRDVDGYLV